MKKRYYILAFILPYLFFTLGNVPAQTVLSITQQYVTLPVKLYGVQGSIWNGSADKAVIPGKPSIDNIQWTINPTMLLLARVSGEAKASIKNQNIIGNFSVSATGTLSASDIRARIDAPVVQELAQMPIGELGGTFNINIESLEIKENRLPFIKGELKWKNAKLTVLDTVDLGFINLKINTDEADTLLATITNTKGQIQLSGDATLDNNKSYKLNLRLTPDSKAPNNIRQSLAMFAKRQTDASYLLKRKGNLTEFGL